MDDMLGNISLYWFTRRIGASFWPYFARAHGAWPIEGPIRLPTGCCAFPHKILRAPREAAARTFTDIIRRWSVMPCGGHFAALEQPAPLAAEISAFFRGLDS